MIRLSPHILPVLMVLCCLTGACQHDHASKKRIVKEGNSLGESHYQKNASSEYLILGQFCGDCIGEDCATMYRFDLIRQELSIDLTDSFWRKKQRQGTINFFTIVKDCALHDEILEFSKNIPDTLLQIEDSPVRIGCPDCTDGCGLYLELSKNGSKKEFYIDPYSIKSGKMLVFIHDFNDLLAKLKNTWKKDE